MASGERILEGQPRGGLASCGKKAASHLQEQLRAFMQAFHQSQRTCNLLVVCDPAPPRSARCTLGEPPRIRGGFFDHYHASNRQLVSAQSCAQPMLRVQMLHRPASQVPTSTAAVKSASARSNRVV